MLEEFDARSAETRDQVTCVIYRWDAPSPFRSFGEYQRALADAYQARADFYDEVITYLTTDATAPDIPARGLVFGALLDARTGCQAAVYAARREARDADRRDAGSGAGS
jgi:hypothetical protein